MEASSLQEGQLVLAEIPDEDCVLEAVIALYQRTGKVENSVLF